MLNLYTATISKYVSVERLPLWVEYVPRGGHIERLFHNHEFSEIAVILHGTALHLTNGGSAPVKAGDVLVLHPGTIHAYDKTGDMEIINIVYDQNKLSLPMLDGYSLPMFSVFFPVKNLPQEQTMATQVMTLADNELADAFLLIKRLEDELKSFKPGNFFLGLALFMEIVTLLARHDANITPEHQFRFQIGEVISFMHRNLQRNISIDELVVVSKMSRRNLFLKFKIATGCSPKEYLEQIRLQHAAGMLINSNLTVSEIATECGFYDSNYLCHVFRQKMKTSPRQFRLTRRTLLKGNID